MGVSQQVDRHIRHAIGCIRALGTLLYVSPVHSPEQAGS